MNILDKIKRSFLKKEYTEINATLCYFISNICSKAFSFITIPLYTNILTTNEYGYLNTFNAWVNMLSVIMGLSLSSAIYVKVKEKREERDRFQSSVFFLSIVSASVLTIVIIVGYVLIKGKIDVIVLMALIQGYATFVVNFILQEWVIDNRYVLHSITSLSTVGIPIAITCLIISKVFKTQKYLCVIIPRTIVFFLFMVIISVYILKRGKCFYEKKIWKWGISYSLPIVFHSLSLTIMLQADRIMLSYLFGYEESGIYSFIYNVTLVIGVFVSALENTWKSWFFYNYKSTEKKVIRSKANLYIVIAILGILVYLLISPDLVRVLASPEYQTQIYLVGPIAFAYIISFLYDFLVYVEYEKEATRNIARASIISAVVNVGLNFLIIPKFGGVGAACTTILSYIVQFLMHLQVVKKLDRELFSIKFFVAPIILGVLSVSIFFAFMNTTAIRYLVILCLTVLIMYILYKNKEKLI